MVINRENLYNFIKKYEIWIFLLLAPISCAVFVYGIHLHLIPGRLYLHGRFFILLFLLMAIVKLARGNSGLKELFKPMLVWKVPLGWYFFSFFFAASIACLTLYLRSLYLGINFTDITLNYTLFGKIDFTFNVIFYALIGEVVWVSFAVRQLSKIINPFFASQIVGVVWALWWIPIVLFDVGVIHNLPIGALMINMMGAAGMCAIVYGQTKSGICVWILQVMLNSSCIIFPVAASVNTQTYWTFSIVYFLVMLSLTYYFNSVKKSQKVKIFN